MLHQNLAADLPLLKTTAECANGSFHLLVVNKSFRYKRWFGGLLNATSFESLQTKLIAIIHRDVYKELDVALKGGRKLREEVGCNIVTYESQNEKSLSVLKVFIKIIK